MNAAAIATKLQQALAFHQRGQLAPAQRIYEEILELQPRHFDALHLLGVLATQAGNSRRAVLLLDAAIDIDRTNAVAYFNRGLALHQQGEYGAALTSYDQALQRDGGFAQAYSNRGVVLHALERFDEALESCTRATAIRPDFAEAHFNRGNVLKALARYEAALDSYDRALAIKPGYAEAHYNRGNVLRALKRWDAALASFDHAIEQKSGNYPALVNRGAVLAELKQWDAAIATLNQALAIEPNAAEAYLSRGNAFRKLRQLTAALADYDRGITIQPKLAEAHSNRGIILQELRQLDAALVSCNRALELDPGLAGAYLNRGVVLRHTRRLDAALCDYDRALALSPDFAEAHMEKGIALAQLKRHEASIASYRLAIAAKPDYADAYVNLGNALYELERLDAGLACFDKALELDAESHYLPGLRLHLKMQMCDWRDLQVDIELVARGVEAGRLVSPPFPVLAFSRSPLLHRQAARIWMRDQCAQNDLPRAFAARTKNAKVKIGYFSADFYAHATSYLMAGLFEMHDRSRFGIVAFSFSPDSGDDMANRVRAAFDQFIDVRNQSDAEVAMLARRLQIDIAVDLKGYTGENRAGIFANGAAPLQVNYLGYPGSLGADYMDYIVADRTLIPEGYEGCYDEKIIYMPGSYQVNDGRRADADRIVTREECGLPRTGFVFCCFNNNFKITPEIFDCWMRILKRVDGSALWLFEGYSGAPKNLRGEAEIRDVNPERLVFAKRLPLAEHLTRHRLADLFLDTLPYNAHTTASDALWAGVPVVTCAGEAFPSRVAASLLMALGMPELVTATLEEYEELAVALALDPKRLKGLTHKLSDIRPTTPLFDTRHFTRCLESAYAQMYERYRQGLPKQHLVVDEAADRS
jgi:protein O-GlcNAc transferase